jgi:hypothetical protein
LHNLQIAEAEARRQRELLEWAAQISDGAEKKLRALQQKEAAEREAWRRVEQFYEGRGVEIVEWDEADHPRQPKGRPEGGQWVEKGGALWALLLPTRFCGPTSRSTIQKVVHDDYLSLMMTSESVAMTTISWTPGHAGRRHGLFLNYCEDAPTTR